MNLNDEYECHTSRCLKSSLETSVNRAFPEDRDFDQVCRILSKNSSDSVISSLYCCDLNCGIKFGDGAGIDSNANKIISRCKSFGISNIIDPGPPPTSKISVIQTSTSFQTSPPSSSSATFSHSESSEPHPIPMAIPPKSIFTSNSQQKILVTSSILNTVPTATPSPPRSSISQMPMAAATRKTLFQSFWEHLSSTAKIGCILGFTLLIFILLLLSLYFLVRHNRRTRLLATRTPSIESFMDTPLPSPTPTPTSAPLSFQTSNSQGEGLEISSIRGGGMGGCRNAQVVVMETEGKNSIDSWGIRWPDKVVLTGEAKEIREWSLGYGLGDGENRRRSLAEERKRAREKSFEYEMRSEESQVHF